jgi:hypothetical protein
VENVVLLDELKTLDLAKNIILVTMILKIIKVADKLSMIENLEIDHTLFEEISQEITTGREIINDDTLTHQYRLERIGRISKDEIIRVSFSIYL